MKITRHRTKPTELEVTSWEKTRAKSGQYLQVPLELSMEFDLVTAGIWAVIYSYQKMKNKVCKLSLAGIGKLVHSNKMTVSRKLQVLIKAGYVELRKDNRLNRAPNWYVVTNKCSLAQKPAKQKDEKYDTFREL
jgi:hypothetical protein